MNAKGNAKEISEEKKKDKEGLKKKASIFHRLLIEIRL